MKFYNIRDADDAIDFFDSIVFPFVYKSDSIMQATNYPVGGSYIRLTMRFVKGREN